MSAEAAKVVEDNNDRFQKQFRYHHGNLRNTLIEAALVILEEEGIEALSLRSIARKSNVSQAAPYSHFKNKRELVSAVAETGFQRLALKMADDATGANGEKNQIEKLVQSYVAFALENKPLFQLMFSNEILEVGQSPTLSATAAKSLSLINAALAKNKAAAENKYIGTAIWALCHGITELTLSKKINSDDYGSASTDEMVKNILKVISY